MSAGPGRRDRLQGAYGCNGPPLSDNSSTVPLLRSGPGFNYNGPPPNSGQFNNPSNGSQCNNGPVPRLEYNGPPSGTHQQNNSPSNGRIISSNNPWLTVPQSATKFDGPNDPGRRGPPGSNQGTPNPSRPGSSAGPPQISSRPGTSSGPLPQNQSRPGSYYGPPANQGRPGSSAGPPQNLGQQGQPRQNPFQGVAPLGYDPAKPPGATITTIEERMKYSKFEIPASAYASARGWASALERRPGYNQGGKAVTIRVNQYKVLKVPDRDVYQYDIKIGTGAEKRGKVMAVWKSKTCQGRLKQIAGNTQWLWDGKKLAWCSVKCPNQAFNVDLDTEKGRAPRPGKPADICAVTITMTKPIRLELIHAYLAKQTEMDDQVFEVITFFDHCMRQGPGEAHIGIKRSFFPRGLRPTNLDSVVMALKGVYASMRMCDVSTSNTGLAVNVDVANATFWIAQDVHQAVRNLLSNGDRTYDYNKMRFALQPQAMGMNLWTSTESLKKLRIMQKLKFTSKYDREGARPHTIKSFTFHEKYGQAGCNAKTFKFNWKDPKTGKLEVISVYDYFKRKHNVSITYYDCPLIETERDGHFPMEACTLISHQKYNFKLSPEQTSAMIKFAVTRPRDRMKAIADGVNMLNWGNDPTLKHYGIKIDSQMSTTAAKILQNPEVQYKTSKVNPGTTGRWDLRGKKFWKENPIALQSWGFCVIEECVNEPEVKNFINVFIQTYLAHGGRITNKTPLITIPPRNTDLAVAATTARNRTGDASQKAPQIMFFILPRRDSHVYERLKRGMECRFGQITQMLAVNHVRQASPQYCSNVCMKVNSKLGGTTCKVADVPGQTFPRKTMIIGADVSHPSPGSPQASTAAITMSMDLEALRFAAFVQSNGYRVEMIEEKSIATGFMELFTYWVQNHREGPAHIYYFRDGVSEGQYQHVLDQEVANMKKHIIMKYGEHGKNIKWTITICSKRHHIRFFPKDNDTVAGDRNGNALPGTLVERDVTHPFEYDFYLSSHSALQGTARPTHYQVIRDEAKCNPTTFQNMVYRHCYQYARSTTPVSLYPAVYYAHLASNRARAHETYNSSTGPTGGQKFEEAQIDKGTIARANPGMATSSPDNVPTPIEAPPLVPLAHDVNNQETLRTIRTSMWYI